VNLGFVPVCGKLLFAILSGFGCVAAIGQSCLTRVLFRPGHKTTQCVGVNSMALVSAGGLDSSQCGRGLQLWCSKCANPLCLVGSFWATCILIPVDGSFAMSG